MIFYWSLSEAPDWEYVWMEEKNFPLITNDYSFLKTMLLPPIYGVWNSFNRME